MLTSDLMQSSLADLKTVSVSKEPVLPFRNLAVVAGAARSGTSWIGQIVDSCPHVAYRFQPFFSYAFQGRVQCDSSRHSWIELLRDLYTTDDPFVLQTKRREMGEYPTFVKSAPVDTLALKTCRYQYLLSPLMRHFPDARIVGVIRHPAAVINSWLRTPSEFPPGSDAQREWRFGACKNQGRESEFFGFYKWREIAHLYLDLHDQFPDRVFVLKYESLVSDPAGVTERLFNFLRLPLTEPTREFLQACHSQHHHSPFSVYKNRMVRDQWRSELPSSIVREIYQELEQTRLEEFLR